MPRFALRRAGALAITALVAAALAGCGDDDAGGTSASGADEASCADAARERSALFGTLPRGFTYRDVPEAELAEMRKTLGEDYRAVDARRIAYDEGQLAALVQVVREPIRREDAHLRGVASGLGAKGPGDKVRINGRDARRIKLPQGTAIVSIAESCSVQYVLGPDTATTERIARAMLR
jgi:hypothetical protein